MKKNIKQIMAENNIQNQLSIEQLLLTDWKNQFDDYQLNEIELGVEKELNVFVYAKPYFYRRQMAQIRWGLEDNLNVSVYAESKLTWKQMRKIRKYEKFALDLKILFFNLSRLGKLIMIMLK